MAEKREAYNPLLKSYPDSEKINAVSEGAETLYTRLLAQADDRNHYYGEPAMILGKLYTRRMCRKQVTALDVEKRRLELFGQGLLGTYHADGEEYIELIGRKLSLRSDIAPDVRFPERVGELCVTHALRARDESGPSTQPNPTQPIHTVPSANADVDAGKSVAGTAAPQGATGDGSADVRGSDELPPGFVRWWAEWPKHFRKRGRSKCLRVWKREKLENISEKVIAALRRDRRSHDWTKQAGAFVPMPMTWLGATPWETDPGDFGPANPVPEDPSPDGNGFVAQVTPEMLAIVAGTGAP